MFCGKCGNKNEEGARFCTECGEPLKNKVVTKSAPSQKNNQITNQGGVRKALKKDAKNHVKGYMMGAVAVLFVIYTVIFSMFRTAGVDLDNLPKTDVFNISLFIADILNGLVSIIFVYGLLKTNFKVSNGEESSFTEIFKSPFDNMNKLGYLLLLSLIVGVISYVIELLAPIPAIGVLASLAYIIAFIYYAPALLTFSMILADPNIKEELSFTDVLKRSLDIVKGHRVEYYGIVFSFIGWFLLSIITIGILLIWILPYVELTLVNMYKNWTNQANFEVTETGLSNGSIIGLTAGGCGCSIVVFITIFFPRI